MRVGFPLRCALALGLGANAVGCGQPAEPIRDAAPRETSVLVVGLDGADWEVIDPLLRQGRMPHLQGLIDQGVRARLLSVSPLLSPVVWTTVATGVEPTRHGILDFLVPDGTGAGQPVTSLQRRVPTVWEMLSSKGVDVGVVGWWASWPADPVRGFLVSDRIAYQLFGFEADPEDASGKTWPPALYDGLHDRIVQPSSVGWERVRPFLEGSRTEEIQFSDAERERLEGLRVAIAAGETHLDIFRSLSDRHQPRLEVVYFEGTDTVAHLFMPFRPPALPGSDPDSAVSFASVVDRYHEHADRHLGELLEGREDGNVIVLSDHGFASGATRPRSTDSRIGHGPAADWHRRFGILVLSGPDFRSGESLDEATVYDIAPTILALFGEPIPESWPGRVLDDALNPLTARPVERTRVEPRRAERAPRGDGPDPAAPDLLEKLRALGYIGEASTGTEDAGMSGITARNNAGLSWLAQGKYVKAEEEFRQALEANPAAAVLQVNLAVTLRNLGRTAEAVVLLGRAIEHPLASRVAGVQLAQIELESGNLDEAERLARRVLAAEPAAADALDVLGLVLEARGDVDGAAAQFEKAADLDPYAAGARNNLGNLEKRRGRVAIAEAWYLRAIEADPFLMGAYSNLALVYQERGQLDRAIDLYHRALGKAPEHPIVLNNLGSLHFDRSDNDLAKDFWRRSALSDAKYPSPLNNLAGLAILAGSWTEAETLLHDALELDPNYGDALINLAHVLRHFGRVDEARDRLRRATGDPRSGILPWIELGRLETSAGRHEDAAAAWQRVLQRNPLMPEAVQGLETSLRHLRDGS